MLSSNYDKVVGLIGRIPADELQRLGLIVPLMPSRKGCYGMWEVRARVNDATITSGSIHNMKGPQPHLCHEFEMVWAYMFDMTQRVPLSSGYRHRPTKEAFKLYHKKGSALKQYDLGVQSGLYMWMYEVQVTPDLGTLVTNT